MSGFIARRIAGAAASTLNDNIVAFWKLGEASGTRADSVGSNDLTDNNTVPQTTGKIGNAAAFTHANGEYLSIASNSDVAAGDVDFSIALWVKFTTLPPPNTLYSLFTKAASAAGDRDYEFLFWNGEGFRFQIIKDDASTAVTVDSDSSVTAPSADTWYFVFAYHDAVNNEIGISVNNGTVDAQSYTGNKNGASSTALHIGDMVNASTTYSLDGAMDAIGLWKKVLTAAEVTELYNSGAGKEYPF